MAFPPFQGSRRPCPQRCHSGHLPGLLVYPDMRALAHTLAGPDRGLRHNGRLHSELPAFCYDFDAGLLRATHHIRGARTYRGSSGFIVEHQTSGFGFVFDRCIVWIDLPVCRTTPVFDPLLVEARIADLAFAVKRLVAMRTYRHMAGWLRWLGIHSSRSLLNWSGRKAFLANKTACRRES